MNQDEDEIADLERVWISRSATFTSGRSGGRSGAVTIEIETQDPARARAIHDALASLTPECTIGDIVRALRSR